MKKLRWIMAAILIFSMMMFAGCSDRGELNDGTMNNNGNNGVTDGLNGGNGVDGVDGINDNNLNGTTNGTGNGTINGNGNGTSNGAVGNINDDRGTELGPTLQDWKADMNQGKTTTGNMSR